MPPPPYSRGAADNAVRFGREIGALVASRREGGALGLREKILSALEQHPLLALACLALLLRLASVPLHAFHHPDEIFQYLEQAHRLATGYGIVPWEYRVGVRNWLIPIFLSWPIWLTDALGFPGPAYIPVIRAFLALLSLSVIFSFYSIGRSISRTHAIVAGVVGAVWFELVYFATHPLSESLSLALFAPAAALVKDWERKSAKALVLAGFLLGLAVLVRYQIVVAAGLLALMTCGYRFRAAWLPLVAGGLLALMLGGGVDLSMGMTPFGWTVNNFTINVFEGRASTYGTSGPAYYFHTITTVWQTSTLLILPLALVGARRYPALFVAAAAHVLAHSLIGHKEYRFVILSTSLIVLLASIGSADLLRWAGRDLSASGRRILLGSGLAFWFLTSLMLAAGDRFRFQWTVGGPALAATQMAGAVPNLCGLAIFDMKFWETGGYSYLHRPVPIFPFESNEGGGGAAALRQSSAAFNAILARSDAGKDIPSSYTASRCASQIGAGRPYNLGAPESRTTCVYVRPGSCTAARGRPDVNEWLIRKKE